jgi:hypothetical protein
MKRIFTLCILLCTAMAGFAQVDSTAKKRPSEEADTIRIGGMIIIRKAGKNREIRTGTDSTSVRILKRKSTKPENVSTNWWIVDLGFSNYTDETNYTTALSSSFVGTGIGKDQLKLRTAKSTNVNIWFFMQRLNIIKHVVNLKYGMGLELNNYRFDDKVDFQKNPTKIVLGTKDYKKNKLAADYITVPIMLNFNFTPTRKNGFGLSAGVSAGYLYSSRWKTKDNGDKNKLRDDFDLKKWKTSAIGELMLGPVKLYGSMALNNMWDKGLDQTPYNVGIRFSNW